MIQPAQPGLVWSSRAGKAGSAAARSIWQELYLQSQTWWRNVLILSGLAVGRTNHNAGVPLSTAGVFGCDQPNGSAAFNFAGTGFGGPGRHLDRLLLSKRRRRSSAVPAPLPVRLRRSLRLRVPLPSAVDPSAADAPGPPKHRVAPRGERRYRRNASRLQCGTPTAFGRLRPDPGGGREVGHSLWLALGRFSFGDHVTGVSVARLSDGHRAARGPWCSGWTSLRLQVVPAPRNTWKCVQGQGSAPEVPRLAPLLARGRAPGRDGLLGIPSGRGWGLSLPGSRRGPAAP